MEALVAFPQFCSLTPALFSPGGTQAAWPQPPLFPPLRGEEKPLLRTGPNATHGSWAASHFLLVTPSPTVRVWQPGGVSSIMGLHCLLPEAPGVVEQDSRGSRRRVHRGTLTWDIGPCVTLAGVPHVTVVHGLCTRDPEP